MAKRPQGLKKASQNKKQKISAGFPVAGPSNSSINSAEPKADSNVPDVTIEVDNDLDPEDDFGQLKAMYFTFLKHKKDLGNLDDLGAVESEEEEDAAKLDLCKKLATGLIHECDALLRKSHEAPKETPEIGGLKLPAEFYNIYALSLLSMASYIESSDEDPRSSKSPESSKNSGKSPKEGPKDFILAAIERAESVVGAADDAEENERLQETGVLYYTLAKAKLRLADEVFKSEESKSLTKFADDLKQVVKDYERAEKAAKLRAYSHENMEILEHLLQIIDALESVDELDEHEENQDLLLELRDTYLSWIKERWQKALVNAEFLSEAEKGLEFIEDPAEVSARANRGLGEYYLALAAPLLAKYEGDVDEDSEEESGDDEDNDNNNDNGDSCPLSDSEMKEVRGYMQNAVEHLLAAKSKQDARTYVVAAEAQISLANLYESDSPEQKDMYMDAVKNLRRAQRLGYGNYQELISELLDE